MKERRESGKVKGRQSAWVRNRRKDERKVDKQRDFFLKIRKERYRIEL